MEKDQTHVHHKVRRPWYGCALVCVLLVPVAILLAVIRIIWCLIDRVTSGMGGI